MRYYLSDFGDVFTTAQKAVEGLSKIPQVAQDVRKFAGAAETIQQPAFQQQVKEIKSDVETYFYAQMALQTISTLAIFGIFLMQLRNEMRK